LGALYEFDIHINYVEPKSADIAIIGNPIEYQPVFNILINYVPPKSASFNTIAKQLLVNPFYRIKVNNPDIGTSHIPYYHMYGIWYKTIKYQYYNGEQWIYADRKFFDGEDWISMTYRSKDLASTSLLNNAPQMPHGYFKSHDNYYVAPVSTQVNLVSPYLSVLYILDIDINNLTPVLEQINLVSNHLSTPYMYEIYVL